MNLDRVENFISAYKSEFQNIHRQEIYKWQAVKHFQEHFNLNSRSFPKMLEESLSKTKNLMDTGSYFPRRMMIRYAEEAPKQVMAQFRSLYDQSIDRISRINVFHKQIRLIHSKHFSDSSLHSYQDHRAIIVYLNLRYPEDNYFYKYEMFKTFIEKVEYDYKIKIGSTSNIIQFYSVGDLIKSMLIGDNELIRMHHDRLGNDEYHDTNLNILTQDFIYAVASHLDVESQKTKRRNELTVKDFRLGVKGKKFKFAGQQTDFERKARENNRVGTLGELLVLKWERDRVPDVQRKKITHDSKLFGDGLGYDIKSIDKDGNPIYIEVKTTKGSFDTPFYVTAHEYERSRKERDTYYLYRVFNYNEATNSGEVMILNGDLSQYCIHPNSYEVKLKIF